MTHSVLNRISLLQWDIFCSVIDNFGDIGVCWRLARNIAAYPQYRIRLWIDNLPSLQRICPSVDPTLSKQIIQNVEILAWGTPFLPVDSANIVIEAFGCRLPEVYLEAMTKNPPVWINLEYLSAEPWIENCHGLASPHPTLPLTKYFFFPGFSAQTGGVLFEPEMIKQRERFQADPIQQRDFWQSLGLPAPKNNEMRLSLFCYANPNISALLTALAEADTCTTCILPQGPAEKHVAAFFRQHTLQPGCPYKRGNLQLYVLPFLEQSRYDYLLWACDINFVRGEDSFIRAQLAARPFIWHIYPQTENTHHLKLQAFLARYAPADPDLCTLWQAWNDDTHNFSLYWQAFMSRLPARLRHARQWSEYLTAQKNLAANLIQFCKNKLK